MITKRGAFQLVYGIFALSLLLVTAGSPAIAECTDADGDGFGVPGDAACTAGSAEDCDDADGAVFPGAFEVCNDVDDDCNGKVDDCCDLGAVCGVGNPDEKTGPCFTAGTVVCPDGENSICDLGDVAPNLFAEEGTTQDNCQDGLDNDCDGATDRADADCTLSSEMLCDGVDDDQNGSVDEGFGLGDSCVVGVGECMRSGIMVCDDLDPAAGAVCTAVEGVPGLEGPAGSLSCSDTLDNDCDGSTDLADLNCLQDELCDGLDNDGDLLVDEDFPNLGESCSAGFGICQGSGIVVCSADGATTFCNGVVGGAELEGPKGPTCRDGLDNDCDGLTDLDDPTCASAELAVSCQLIGSRPLRSCDGLYQAQFFASDAPVGTQLSGALLGLDVDDTLLGSVDVASGDLTRMFSRNPHPQVFSNRRQHFAFAPIPMLQATADTGQVVSEAFCSNIPAIDIRSPDGGVVSTSQGNQVGVLAALTQVDPATLVVMVDGIDVLGELGIDVASLPGGPYSGSIVVNGRTVEVVNLMVDVAPDLATESSNTLAMTLVGLPGGGHIVAVDAEPKAGPPSSCTAEDLADFAVIDIFDIEILSPQPFEIVTTTPVTIVGKVLHGRAIAGLSINGKPIDVSAQVFHPGDGIETADTYELNFEVDLGVTNLIAELNTGEGTLGTLDPGWNRLIGDAQDEFGNRVFARSFIGVSNDAALAAADAASDPAATPTPTFASDSDEKPTPTPTFRVKNGMIAGMNGSSVKTVVSSVCNNNTLKEIDKVVTQFVAEMDDIVQEFPEKIAKNCNTKSYLKVDPRKLVFVTSGFDPSCTTAFKQMVDKDDKPKGKPWLEMSIPLSTRMDLFMDMNGQCLHKAGAVCIRHIEVKGEAVARLEDTEISLIVTEPDLEISNILMEFPDPLSLDEVDLHVTYRCLEPFLIGTFLPPQIKVLLRLAIDPLADFTLEHINVNKFLPASQRLGQAIPVSNIKVKVPNSGLQYLSSFDATELNKNPNFLTATFRSEFRPKEVDPGIPPFKDIKSKAAPLPDPSQSTVDMYIAFSDDILNDLFKSLTEAGKLKGICEEAGIVDDYLPEDCDSIHQNPAVDPIAQGYCHGLRGADCETIGPDNNPVGASKQGACHGVEGNKCSQLETDLIWGTVEKETCRTVPSPGVTSDTPLLACPVQELPPRFLLPKRGQCSLDSPDFGAECALASEDCSPGSCELVRLPSDSPPLFDERDVEAWLRLNDLSVQMIADRNENRMFDGESSITPDCGGAGDTAVDDCRLLELCLDLNVGMNVEGFLPTPTPTPTFDPEATPTPTPDPESTPTPTLPPGAVVRIAVDSLQQVGNRPAGVVCGGSLLTALNTTGQNNSANQVAASEAIQYFLDNMSSQIPAMKTEGMSFGGLLEIKDAKAVTIETDADNVFYDYLAIGLDVEGAEP